MVCCTQFFQFISSRLMLDLITRSSFEVDARDLEHPTVHLEVLIDGSSKYKYVISQNLSLALTPIPLMSRLAIVGKPVHLYSNTALGALIPQGVKGMFNKIGLSPIKWF